MVVVVVVVIGDGGGTDNFDGNHNSLLMSESTRFGGLL